MVKTHKFVKGADFMGNEVYWLDGIASDTALRTENVCGIFKNPYYEEKTSHLSGEKRYVCELIKAPHHEDVETDMFNSLKEAKEWGLRKFTNLQTTPHATNSNT